MRIRSDIAAVIHETAAEIFGAPVRLFGSRLDDTARDGELSIHAIARREGILL